MYRDEIAMNYPEGKLCEIIIRCIIGSDEEELDDTLIDETRDRLLYFRCLLETCQHHR